MDRSPEIRGLRGFNFRNFYNSSATVFTQKKGRSPILLCYRDQNISSFTEKKVLFQVAHFQQSNMSNF